jgi:transposase-like protein
MIDKSRTKLVTIVEADETYVGGKRKFSKRGRGAEHKTPVFGLVERNGQVRTWIVPNCKAKTLKPIIRENVKKGAVIMTDEFRAYRGLSKDYTHKTVNHSIYEYVVDDIHVNTLEGFWSLLKRGIKGIYHCPSKKHLSKYCAEFTFRYNTRKLTDANRFSLVLIRGNTVVKYRDIIQT